MEKKRVEDLAIKLFVDGASIVDIKEMKKYPWVGGFTTNPSLMRQAGVDDYKSFALDVLNYVPDLPISFEVFTDDLDEMIDQAMEIASWGKNINVKIPVSNTKGEFAGKVISTLANSNVKVNVTAVLTLDQVRRVADCLNSETPAIISVFAGRIADTGIDPEPVMSQSIDLIASKPNVELLWASSREFFNIIQAEKIGCHIITVTRGILSKLKLLGKDLSQYSLETVSMFYNDAQKAGYKI